MSIYTPNQGRERRPGQQRTSSRELAAFFRLVHEAHRGQPITFVCVGTDRSTGDSLGPLAGTMLKNKGFTNVLGTMDKPCDAHSLESVITSIPSEHTVIAIDACLGLPGSVGLFLTSEGPLWPAQSVGLALPGIGDYSIAGVVNAYGPKPYWTLQTTSLHSVLMMASQIAEAAAVGFGFQIEEAAQYSFR
ncbi:spore protease YyaC [Paenibacillus massiliensis]|uniref:spore protease YyaC n=1 Tax=Paenibacillus massiliensis TaxID=225917 RepID=UPI0003FDE605|nr:spore protease YyaC [Paenibacillus massiliensis]